MKRSYFIALGMVLIATLWMMSGGGEKPNEEAAAPKAERKSDLTRVRVSDFEAEPMHREVVVNGATEAKRVVTIKAKTAGEVQRIAIKRGERVKAGELLLQLADDGRSQRVKQAEALLRQREIEYAAARSLSDKGLKADSQVAEAKTLLEAAQSELEAAQLDRKRAAIQIPFDGVLETRSAEVGTWVGVGDPIATVVDSDPIRVTGEVAEIEVESLEKGMPVQVRLGTGTTFEAKLTYIATSADPATRTFEVEAEAANPDAAYPVGMTAEMRIPLHTVPAHALTPALLSLDDEGRVGVKAVDEQSTVRFYPVELLSGNPQKMWVGGLPQTVRLITVGQGFVRAGDKVEAVEGEAP